MYYDYHELHEKYTKKIKYAVLRRSKEIICLLPNGVSIVDN